MTIVKKENHHLMSSNLGFPRIGENREWKKALEAYWSGKTDEQTLHEQMKMFRLNNLQKQRESGIDLIPVGDFSYYDQMLDLSVMFGLVPQRFGTMVGPVPLSTYFAMARGNDAATACEMTKWFNTNYHYIVPELEGKMPVLLENRPLQAYKEAKQQLGIEGKPVFIGPYTFVKLAKGYKSTEFIAKVREFIPVYVQLLQELALEGVQWVQIDEPALVMSLPEEHLLILHEIYEQLSKAAPSIRIILQTYFDSVEHYEAIVALPVAAIGIDFIHGVDANLEALQKYGFPADKWLAAGIIDGRNIWRADLTSKLELIQQLSKYVPDERLIIQPSCSLLHVPVNLQKEAKLDPMLRNALAFADEKLLEIEVLCQLSLHQESDASKRIIESTAAVRQLNESVARKLFKTDVASSNLASIGETAPQGRNIPFAERRILQKQKWQLPLLPTTTIGSFPQSAEVRQARQLFRKGEWTQAQYDKFIQAQIQHWIQLQEEIGLDVLVHGEFERTDMVEFFGEKLIGFAFTQNGWVQSYGSRCVKPPLIYGDVDFDKPMTVEETVYAQSLTTKPVKGMLTGPITILNWSFVRDDISRQEVALQLALALRQEVEALEASGIEMIQVDEPALREGLPLKRKNWDHYLNWAVQAFRISTATVKPTTQIHTHMCYCEFNDIIKEIRDIDADVISIESSRSHGELISSFEATTYDKGIGLGVYDIHSPRVPHVEEMLNMIQRALKVLPAELFWVNPDCGLKTRNKAETVAALIKMVQATKEARETLSILVTNE